MSKTQSGIDFTKVELLRRRLLLTKEQLCLLFGVSRMSYHNWCKDPSIVLRPAQEQAVRATLRAMLAVVKKHGWPRPEHLKMHSAARFELFRQLMADEQT